MIDSVDIGLKLPFKIYYMRFKYKEIAESLSMNIGIFKSRIFVARMKMIIQLD
jgi:DNA-directed RNA polymerase specialized sigma24 family protein